MVTLKNFDYYTEHLAREIDNIDCQVISSIVQTSIACPEQYEFFDKYGWQVGYMRLRSGELTVSCPDCCEQIVFSHNNEDHDMGDGAFISNERRVYYMMAAIKSIENYFAELQFVKCKKVINGTGIYSIDPDMMQYALKELYNYQSSHFLPTEVLDMRNNGPAVTWKQAVKKFVNINYSTFSNMDIDDVVEYIKSNMSKIIFALVFIFDKNQEEIIDQITSEIYARRWRHNETFGRSFPIIDNN